MVVRWWLEPSSGEIAGPLAPTRDGKEIYNRINSYELPNKRETEKKPSAASDKIITRSTFEYALFFLMCFSSNQILVKSMISDRAEISSEGALQWPR